MSIPTSPNDMPSEWHNNERELRNILVSLDQFDCVDICWERDNAASNACGETVGEWSVLIEDGPRTIRAKHTQVTNAIWYASTVAEAQHDEAYEKRQSGRAAALAKLTQEDRKLLGV